MIDYDRYGYLVWVSAGSLTYDQEQVEFLLPYLNDLREGKYPLRHLETGYIGGSRTRSQCAPFEKACLVAAELDIRLSHIGQDRTFVEYSYCDNWDDKKIAKHFSKEEWYVRQQIENGVSYISSGDCPRWLPCGQCHEFTKCRKRKKGKREPVDYKEWCRRRNARQNRQLGTKVLF